MKLPKAIAIVGTSKSGKTTLIEALVKLAKSRGFKVAAVKHAPHGAEIDRVGSDSERFFKAGADASTVVTRTETLLRIKGPIDPREMLKFFEGYDIVIFEGFKKNKLPKIEVIPYKKAPLKPLPENVIARVSSSKRLDKFLFAHQELKKLLALIEELS